MKQSKRRRPSDSRRRIVGGALVPNVAIAEKYASPVQDLIRQMARETHADLAAMFNAPGYAMDDERRRLRDVKDGSPAARARIIINRLMDKYRVRFNDLAASATKRMIRATVKHVDKTAGMSLREMSKDLQVTDFWSPRLTEIVAASTQEAVQLIKTIPERFLAQVQGETMRAITSGRGLADLTPFLQKHYGEATRKAKNVALDQTRKAYGNLAAQRMRDVGIKKFIWKHSHGGHEPRKQHQEWDGKVFRYDDLPVDDRFGPVLPGQAIGCKCFGRPCIDFGDDDDGEED